MSRSQKSFYRMLRSTRTRLNTDRGGLWVEEKCNKKASKKAQGECCETPRQRDPNGKGFEFRVKGARPQKCFKMLRSTKKVECMLRSTTRRTKMLRNGLNTKRASGFGVLGVEKKSHKNAEAKNAAKHHDNAQAWKHDHYHALNMVMIIFL